MMWDFPKKWLGLVAIIELYFSCFWKTNQSVERMPITMNVQEKEIEKRVNRKYRIQRNRKEQL